MNAIEKAEAALSKAKKEAADKARADKVALNEFCLGKYVKRVDTHSNSCSISYIAIKDVVRFSDGRPMYGMDHSTLVAERLSVSFSTVGFVNHMGNIRYLGMNNRVRMPLKKHYNKETIIGRENRYHYGYVSIDDIIPSKESVYIDNHWYTFCSSDEFEEVRDLALAANAQGMKDFKKFSDYDDAWLYKKGLVDFNPGDRVLLENLLRKIDDGDVRLSDYIKIAKQTRSFMSFTNSQLTELAQYSLTGELGLNLLIVGGNDGSDYEPYITKYVLESVSIDWKQVLYTIRGKLDSVLDTAADLEKVSAVYNPYNWNVSYDGTYDVSFGGAVLNSPTLAQVNAVIIKHLK